MSYKINRINDDIIQLYDCYYDCIYIIKGTKKALVIDLGMDHSRIKPIIEYLVDTPYEIICTHGHFDHVGRSGEFHSISMSLLDKDVYLDNESIVCDEYLSFIDFSKINDIKSFYHIGDRIIHVIACPGHTPGSILLLDEKNKMIFTGDAIGSGCGVWMQVDHALSLDLYQNHLKECLEIFQHYDVDETWQFFGGHGFQEYQSKVSSFNKFDYQLFKDMAILCEKLNQNKLDYEEIVTKEFSTGCPYYAKYNKAEIIFTLSQLKQKK